MSHNYVTLRFKIISHVPDENQKHMIWEALNVISSKTCITYKKLEPGFKDSFYVMVESGDGCSSNVGFNRDVVHISLNIEVRTEEKIMMQN